MKSKPVVLRGGKGPGSRQPVLKLPSMLPDGRRIKLHPLTALMRERGMTSKEKTALAVSMGIKPQSLYKWELACAVDRNFPLPVLRARQIADYFKVPPSLFRPDFPWTPSNEAVTAKAA